MGDRANVVVKSGSEQVCLYTHWDGSGLGDVLTRALKRGESRLDDFQYLTRIIFCEMIQDDVLGTTGYGITQNPWDGDDKIFTVDVDAQTVEYNGEVVPIREF